MVDWLGSSSVCFDSAAYHARNNPPLVLSMYSPTRSPYTSTPMPNTSNKTLQSLSTTIPRVLMTTRMRRWQRRRSRSTTCPCACAATTRHSGTHQRRGRHGVRAWQQQPPQQASPTALPAWPGMHAGRWSSWAGRVVGRVAGSRSRRRLLSRLAAAWALAAGREPAT